MTFAERLKKVLKKKGLTQKEAALAAGISPQTIHYIISNNLKTSKLAAKIAFGLDVNPSWLVYGEGRLEEVRAYEVPVINNLFDLESFLNGQMDQDDQIYMFVNKYYSEKAFAFRLRRNTIAICRPISENDVAQKYMTVDFENNKFEVVGSEVSSEPRASVSFKVCQIVEDYDE